MTTPMDAIFTYRGHYQSYSITSFPTLNKICIFAVNYEIRTIFVYLKNTLKPAKESDMETFITLE